MGHKSKKIFKIIASIFSLLIFLWAMMIGIDYRRTTHSFEKPVFARCTLGMDDGGSGTYKGLGYSIKIEGNFMPEDEFPGVTHARFMVFGRELKKVMGD